MPIKKAGHYGAEKTFFRQNAEQEMAIKLILLEALSFPISTIEKARATRCSGLLEAGFLTDSLLEALFAAKRQYLKAVGGDRNGVLPLGGQFLIASDHGPAVFLRFNLRPALVDHRLDGERHALL